MERERGEAAVELADGASERGQLQEKVGGQERRKGCGFPLQEGKGQADRLLYEGCLRWLQWSMGGKELLRNGIDVRIHNRFLKIGKLRVKQEERKGLKNGVLLILGQGEVHKKPPF